MLKQHFKTTKSNLLRLQIIQRKKVNYQEYFLFTFNSWLSQEHSFNWYKLLDIRYYGTHEDSCM